MQISPKFVYKEKRTLYSLYLCYISLEYTQNSSKFFNLSSVSNSPEFTLSLDMSLKNFIYFPFILFHFGKIDMLFFLRIRLYLYLNILIEYQKILGTTQKRAIQKYKK